MKILISSLNAKKTKKDTDYIVGNCLDEKKMQHLFVVWAVDDFWRKVTSGHILEVEAEGGKFGDSDALIIRSALFSDNPDDITLFQKKTPFYDKRMEIWANICNMVSPEWQPLLQFISSHPNFELFSRMYGGKSKHHAFIGGLMEHSLAVAKLCLDTAKSYSMYPGIIDRDLLIVSALIHDFMKTEEYVVDASGMIKDMTHEYYSDGHINKMYALLKSVDHLIPNKKLYHMILSHHGIPEFGSPIRPIYIEALILSSCDLLDASISAIRETFENTSEDSAYVSLIERKFWR